MAKQKEIKVKERIGHTKEIPETERVAIIEESSRTVGRSVFFSVIIMIISFAPILFLTGQEKKLFTPLVLTKTFSLIGAAILAITVAPMLTRTFMKCLTAETRCLTFFLPFINPWQDGV
jgi:copper/silver efflux system protein